MARGDRAAARSGRRVRVELRALPWAELRVHAPSVAELPDTFVLADAEATGPDDAVYWCERPVTESILTANADPEAGDFYTLVFDWAPGPGKVADQDALFTTPRPLRYTLRHRPQGTADDERVVFEGRRGVFASTDVVSGGPDEHVLNEPYMHSFGAVRFEVSDDVDIPAPLAESMRLDVRPAEPDRLRREPGEGASQGPSRPSGPAPEGSLLPLAPPRPPVEPVAVRDRAWPAGAPCPHEPGDVLADDARAAAELETWVYLFATRSQGLGPTVRRASEFLGVWQAAPDGRYVRATYSAAPSSDAEAADPDETPSTGPTPTPHVLLDAGLITSPSETVFAYVSAFPLPLGRVREILGKLQARADGGELDDPVRRDALTPLFVRAHRPNGGGESTFEWAGGHVAWEGGAWTLSLPHPALVSVRLAQGAERAARRYEDWSRAASGAYRNARLIATAAYGPTQRRDYLDDLLQDQARGRTMRHSGVGFYPVFDDPSETGVVGAWAGFDAEAVGGGPRPLGAAGGGEVGSQLQQFLFGYHCQRAYLRRRMRVAGRRLEAWAAWAFDEVRYDLDAVLEAETTADYAEPALALNETLFACDGAMVSAGCGAWALVARVGGTPLLDRLDQTRPEGVPDVLAALVGDGGAGGVRAKPFKVTWKLAKKSAQAGARFLETLAPVLAVTRRSRRTRYGVASRLTLYGLMASVLSGRDDVTVTVQGDGVRVGDLFIREIETTTTTGNRLWVFEKTTVETRTSVYFDRGRLGARFNQGLSLVSALVNGATFAADLGDGEVGADQLISLLKAVSDGASFANSAHRTSSPDGAFTRAARATFRTADSRALARSAAALFGRLSNVWEVAATGSKVWKEGGTETARGARDEWHPDGWGMAGALFEGTGSVLASSAGASILQSTVARVGVGAAGAVAGVSAGTVALAGLALMGVGYGLQALGSFVERTAQKRDDPLSWWLPLHSPWGAPLASQFPFMVWPAEDRARTAAARARFPDQRRRLLQLVTPDGDLGLVQATGEGEDRTVASVLGSPDPIEGQTEDLLRTAFTFPVSVYVPPAEAAAGPFALDVDLCYVPVEGTLVVSASLTGQLLPRAFSLACAVHYVKTSEGYRYTVREPSAPLTGGAPFRERAESEGWAHAHEPGGDRVVLRVHVGPGWEPVPDGLAVAAAEGPGEAGRQATGWVPASGPLGVHVAERARAAGRALRSGLEAYRSRAGSVVWARSVLDAPALGGRWAVAGAVFFRPLAPVDPDPPVPAPGDRPPLTAFELVHGRPDGFTYTGDAR